MKFRAMAAAALAATLGLTAPASAQDPAKGGDLVVAMAVTLPSVDPHASTGVATRYVSAHMFEGVVTRGETGDIIPQLAASYEMSDDARTYTFTLRDGVRFHDGSTLDAGDVVASLQRMKDAGVDQGVMALVENLEAVDDLTVRVTMSEPHPTFLDSLSSPRVIVGIMPEEIAALPKEEFKPVGTGPFEFVEWVPDSHIRLARFEAYSQQAEATPRDGFGGKRTVYVDTVTFRTVPEAGAQIAGLLTGDYHIADQVSPQDVPRLEASDEVSAVKVLPWYMVHQTFNLTKPLGADENFRKAVQVGLDLEVLLDFATGGNYVLGHGWQYDGFPYYSDAGIETYNLGDVDKAKELLAQSAYDGEEIEILTISDEAALRDYAIALADQLGKLGIKTRINAQNAATWSALRVERESWTIIIGGFGMAPSIGPFGMLRHFSGDGSLQGVTFPEIEDAAHRVRTGLTFEERKKAFEDYQAGVLGKAISIRAGAAGIFIGVRDEVKNFEPGRVIRAWDIWLAP
ncbi:Oligopeptide ABC transporter, periplasmic oligopeptide-binding protein OppA (plasmid) [Marinovum algicola DG 898]|uniref:ABC transporter substrate-binding protein n=1 Tax=Marinovum algicola TaxID=42444 RepID=UPI00065B25C1|nr:Oligopeptide ABC transporter, periplasmic oligopeptide-binding protein OppA [Marinovum algicola DG 898]